MSVMKVTQNGGQQKLYAGAALMGLNLCVVNTGLTGVYHSFSFLCYVETL